MPASNAGVLRDPTSPQHVTFLELFFDLVFVFALDRVAQGLIDKLDWSDLLETMVLLPAVLVLRRQRTYPRSIRGNPLPKSDTRR